MIAITEKESAENSYLEKPELKEQEKQGEEETTEEF